MQDKDATVTVSLREYEQLQSELSYVKQQLADLQRLIFGKSSERFIPSDVSLRSSTPFLYLENGYSLV